METIDFSEEFENPFFPDEVYDNLPPLLKTITDPFEERDKDMALIVSIVLLGGCLSNITGEYDGRVVYPMLMAFLIAPAGFGKGSIALILLILKSIEQKLKEKYKADMELYNQINESNKQRKKEQENDSPVKGDKINPKPKRELLCVPGNSSAAALITHLEESNGRLIVFETEADTLSNSLQADWGNWSDLVRKAFHHESISSSRKTNNELIMVDFPKLAMLITGTPGQAPALLRSAENGMFSRFIYYAFFQAPRWRDVRPGRRVNLNKHFEALAPEVLEIVEYYETNPSTFDFTDDQWDIFNSFCIELLHSVTQEVSEDASSIVMRLGLITFRIAMIISALRNYVQLNISGRIYCTDEDFVRSMNISRVLYHHSVYMFNLLPKKETMLNRSKTKFYESLPDDQDFSRLEAVEIGKHGGYKPRTVDDYLKKLVEKGVLEHIKQGTYRKM